MKPDNALVSESDSETTASKLDSEISCWGRTYHLHVIQVDTEMPVAVELPPSGMAPSRGYTEAYAAPEAIGSDSDGVVPVNTTTDIYSPGKVLMDYVRRRFAVEFRAGSVTIRLARTVGHRV